MRLSWLALLVPALLVLAGGTIIAAHAGDGTSTITACARLKDGRLRVSPPDVSCRHKEQALQWNVQGPPGPAGADGAVGPAGPAGSGRPAGACRSDRSRRTGRSSRSRTALARGPERARVQRGG